MNEDSVRLIRETWARAASAHTDTARLFYGRLFKIAPDTRQLFADDMGKQGVKLIDTLGFIVDNLTDEAALIPAAQDLAIRHLDYGVEAEHYASVREALLWTLEQILASDYSPAVDAAWRGALNVLETVMIEAAYPEK